MLQTRKHPSLYTLLMKPYVNYLLDIPISTRILKNTKKFMYESDVNSGTMQQKLRPLTHIEKRIVPIIFAQ